MPKVNNGDTRVVKKVDELPNGDFKMTFTIDLSAIHSELYLSSCLVNEKFCGPNEINHDISFSDSSPDMIFTVTVKDVISRSDFNHIEAKVKRSINLARQENSKLLCEDLSWIHTNKTFHVR